ncbi:MAG: hypothetical protein QXH26_02370 [Candidatus Hadarchaeales archaeon]
MRRWVFLLVLLLLPPACAQPVTVGDLLSHPENFNNTKVTIRGEVFGILRRGREVWVSVENGGVIGVFCRVEMTENLKVAADYRHKGDIIEVVGIFHMACPEHGGDVDLHAENLWLVERGYEIPREANLWLVALALSLFGASAFVSLKLKRTEKSMPPYWY